MLGKLFKYDFKWINKVMYVFYIILVIISIAIKIVECMDQTLLLVIVDKILSAMFIGCAFSMLITCVIRTWHRFINSIYKDEGYLTHTLPVSKNLIFNSKILSGIFSFFISTLVVILCVLFVYSNMGTVDLFKIAFHSLVDNYNGLFAVLFVIGIVFLVAFEIIFFVMSGILGIVIGHCSNNMKLIRSIAIGIGCYSLLSIMSLIGVGVILKMNHYSIMENGVLPMDYFLTIGLVLLVIYSVYNLICYFVARIVFNKGVNVE